MYAAPRNMHEESAWTARASGSSFARQGVHDALATLAGPMQHTCNIATREVGGRHDRPAERTAQSWKAVLDA
jgi:hypothetical protein